jgi:hypothetical protein
MDQANVPERQMNRIPIELKEKIQAARAAKSGFALFKSDSTAKLIRTSAEKRYTKMLNDFPHDLIGVYTDDCPMKWIADDLEFCGLLCRSEAS